MTEEHKELVIEAHRKFGVIFPVLEKPTYTDCFATYKGILHFYFNTKDHSTHIVSKLDKREEYNGTSLVKHPN